MWVEFIIIVLIILWISRHNNTSEISSKSEKPISIKNEIKEETVFKRQTEFEKKLQETYLPDAISGIEIYIYKNLMSVWYDKLSSENRYNNEMIQKLRNDWLDYMSALEDRSTYNFLSLEAEKPEEQDSFREDHINASRKSFAIEEAFAAAVGKEAIDELARIRGLDFSSFDNNGNLAPDGFKFDIYGELCPKK